MSRIRPVDESVSPAVAELLAAVKGKLGVVPNMVAVMANSPAVARAYLAFSQSLSAGALPVTLREQLALAVSQANGCDYCLAAHTALGRRVGISGDNALDARRGRSSDAREHAAMLFALKVLEARGRVTDEDLAQVRGAGYSDAEISEIIAHVSLNVFTNYFNIAADTEVDFPPAPVLSA